MLSSRVKARADVAEPLSLLCHPSQASHLPSLCCTSKASAPLISPKLPMSFHKPPSVFPCLAPSYLWVALFFIMPKGGASTWPPFLMLLLLLLSRFSRVHLFATPWTAARQAPLSMGFPRQEACGGFCHCLLQGIFLTQGRNACLLHWQAGPSPRSHQGSPEPTLLLCFSSIHTPNTIP